MKKFFHFAGLTVAALFLTLLVGVSVTSVTNELIGFVVTMVLAAANFIAIVNSKAGKNYLALNTIGTVASGVGVTTAFNGVKGIPGMLVFEVSTTPQSITVNINGRVTTVLLDTAGINNLANPRTNGRPATSFAIPISNGLQTEFTMDISVVNNVAAAFDLLAISGNCAPVDAPGFYVSSRQTVNAGSIQVFDDFTYLALPNMVALDQLTILGNKKNREGQYVNGSWSSRAELGGIRALISQRENAVSGLVPAKVAFDNYDRDYQQINFQPNATQVVYVQRLVGADFRGLEVFN
jgi:hypothetical protein